MITHFATITDIDHHPDANDYIFITFIEMSHMIVSSVNKARTQPESTATAIYQLLADKYHGTQFTAYGKRVETFQGKDVLVDLRDYLSKMPATSVLVESPALNRAAEIIATRKGQSGETTHEKPRVINQLVETMCRLQGKVGELICLSATTAEQIATYFLLDDGLATRKRRRMLLDPSYKYIGAGTATHALHGTIAVILLAQHLG